MQACTSPQSDIAALADVWLSLGGPACMMTCMRHSRPRVRMTEPLPPAGAAPDNCHGGAAPVHAAGGPPAAAAASRTAAAWAAAARVSPRGVRRDDSRAAAGPTPAGWLAKLNGRNAKSRQLHFVQGLQAAAAQLVSIQACCRANFTKLAILQCLRGPVPVLKRWHLRATAGCPGI